MTRFGAFDQTVATPPAATTCVSQGAFPTPRLLARASAWREPGAASQLAVQVRTTYLYRLDGKTAEFSPANIFRAIPSRRSRHLLRRELTVLGFNSRASLISS